MINLNNYELENFYSRQRIMGNILIKNELSNILNIPIRSIKVNKTQKGKPYIDDHLSISVSYSYNWIVCAVSNNTIGVDIEKVNNLIFDYNLVEYVLTKNEKRKFDSIKSINNQQSYFFSIWTAKESLVKFLGEGITNENISQIDVKGNYAKYKNKIYNISSQIFNNCFWLSVCQKQLPEKRTVKIIRDLEV
jgi:4'-phosphopantetheinyl transferase